MTPFTTDLKPSSLKIGWDVPYTVAWSAETLFSVKPCPFSDGHLAISQNSAPGQGQPVFKRVHWNRQREAVRKLLCGVCGRPTTDDNRWIFATALPVDKPDGNWAGAEPPVHLACAERARAACPFISKHGLEPVRFPAATQYRIYADLRVPAYPGAPRIGPIIHDLKYLIRSDYARKFLLPQRRLIDAKP